MVYTCTNIMEIWLVAYEGCYNRLHRLLTLTTTDRMTVYMQLTWLLSNNDKVNNCPMILNNPFSPYLSVFLPSSSFMILHDFPKQQNSSSQLSK